MPWRGPAPRLQRQEEACCSLQAHFFVYVEVGPRLQQTRALISLPSHARSSAAGTAAPRLQRQEEVQASLRAVLLGQHKYQPSALSLLQVGGSSTCAHAFSLFVGIGSMLMVLQGSRSQPLNPIP